MGINFKFGKTFDTPNHRNFIVGRNFPMADYEPARANRFILYTLGAIIPSYSIRNYAFYYENDDTILEINFYDFVNFTFNPNETHLITGFVIDFLDPTGVVYGTLRMNAIRCLEYEKSGDYSSDDITNNRMKFLISII